MAYIQNHFSLSLWIIATRLSSIGLLPPMLVKLKQQERTYYSHMQCKAIAQVMNRPLPNWATKHRWRLCSSAPLKEAMLHLSIGYFPQENTLHKSIILPVALRVRFAPHPFWFEILIAQMHRHW